MRSEITARDRAYLPELPWEPREFRPPPPSSRSCGWGERLTMSDGSQWFHPYTGAKPIEVTPHIRAVLVV